MASGPYWVEGGERKMGPIPYIQGAVENKPCSLWSLGQYFLFPGP